MKLEEYRHLDGSCICILKNKFPKTLTLQNLNQICSTNLDLSELITLLGYPSRKLKKKMLLLIEKILNRKLPLSFFSEMGRIFTSREQDGIYSFSLYYLMSSDFALYLSLEKQIKNNFLSYEPYLIKLLVHEIDVLGLNSARMLHKYASSKYESDNVLKILPNITESQKEDMFQILKLRLVDPHILLHQKEDAIMKLGALNFLPSLEILKTFADAPQLEIREILAKSLGNLRSEHSNNLLYKLLLDENKRIHY
ncbi:MAG: hypothetical protein ACTSWD_09150, partial [Candidatus Heimdallarchaeota archaeon]